MNRYPHAVVEYDGVSATYYPASPEGFIVRLHVAQVQDAGRYLVFYGGSCQEEEDRRGSVLNFGFGLSNGCRLRQFSRDRRVYRWVTEIDGWNGWKPYWETFDFTGPFWEVWKKPKVVCLQNDLIDLSASGGACCATR